MVAIKKSHISRVCAVVGERGEGEGEGETVQKSHIKQIRSVAPDYGN